LVGKTEVKRPLGRPRCRWNDIRIELKEIGREDSDWIQVAQDKDQW